MKTSPLFSLCLIALLLAPLAEMNANPVTNGIFNIRKYGAAGDGKTSDTETIQKGCSFYPNHGLYQ